MMATSLCVTLEKEQKEKEGGKEKKMGKEKKKKKKKEEEKKKRKKFLPRRQRPLLLRHDPRKFLVQKVQIHGISKLGHHQETLHSPSFSIFWSRNGRRRGRESVEIFGSLGFFCILDYESELLHQCNVVLVVLIIRLSKYIDM